MKIIVSCLLVLTHVNTLTAVAAIIHVYMFFLLFIGRRRSRLAKLIYVSFGVPDTWNIDYMSLPQKFGWDGPMLLVFDSVAFELPRKTARTRKDAVLIVSIAHILHVATFLLS